MGHRCKPPDNHVTRGLLRAVSRDSAVGRLQHVSGDGHVIKEWSDQQRPSLGDEEGESGDILAQWRLQRKIEQARREAKLSYAGNSGKNLLVHSKVHHTAKKCSEASLLFMAKSQLSSAPDGGPVSLRNTPTTDEGNSRCHGYSLTGDLIASCGKETFCEEQREQQELSGEEQTSEIGGRDVSVLDALVDQVWERLCVGRRSVNE